MSWSAFICEDLKTKIVRGKKLPDRMSLSKLSRHYGVSTTPVRIAVDELIVEEFLIRAENGRLVVNRKKQGTNVDGAETVAPEPPRNYREIIAKDLFCSSLAGKGEFIREEQTANQYGVSPTAVREVFHQLAGQGMLRHIPRRGWKLRPFRTKDLEDYLKIREVMELTSLDLAWPNLVDEDLKKIYDGNQLPSAESEWPTIDNSLHDYIVDKADNYYARDFFDRHGKYFQMIYDWDALDRESAIEAVEQHREIISAMLCRDKIAAKDALSLHIRTNYAIMKALLPTEDKS